MRLIKLVFFATLAVSSLTSTRLDASDRNNHASDLQVPRAPEQGGPRRWLLASTEPQPVFDAPSVEAEVLDHLSKGTVLSNLGCQAAGTRVWCSVQTLDRPLLGYVDAKSLTPSKDTSGVVTTGVNDSPGRAKKGDFNAKAEIPCAQIEGQDLGICLASAAQSGGGDATIVITFSNGFKRTLFFVNGRFTRANATMSGVGTDTDWYVENGTFVIRVDDQRFKLPVDLTLGN